MREQIPFGAAQVLPGEILADEFLKPLMPSQRGLARRMGINPMRISGIIRGQRAITADTALRLADVFGTSARFWMNLQANHDLALAAVVYRKVA